MFSFWRDYVELNKSVLGLNRRNLDYIQRYNSAVFKKYVDNKLLNKRILKKHGLPYPKVLKIVRRLEDIDQIDWDKLPRSFVIKPGRGSQGRGILVVFGRRKNRLEWVAADGRVYSKDMLAQRLKDIISGYYSMGTGRDVAFIEERIKVHPKLKPYTYKGIPDIRLIVFKKVPVMAMLRLPTRRSKGTANLHAGAIAVGIDLRLGITTKAIVLKEVDIWGDTYEFVTHHPDAKYLALSGLKIPYWDKVLELAIRAQIASKLGYVGVDIAIDRDRGPLVLEINARPGLGIQVANEAGLKERLEAVKSLKVRTIPRAIEVAKALFGGEIEEEVEAITGKQIVGLVEPVVLKPPAWLKKDLKKRKVKALSEYTTKAKVDTGALYSSIDAELALRLGFVVLEEVAELLKKQFDSRAAAREFAKQVAEQGLPSGIEALKIVRSANGIMVRPVIKIPTFFAGDWRDIKYTVSNRKHLVYKVLIGRVDMKGMLVDPSLRRRKTFTADTMG